MCLPHLAVVSSPYRRVNLVNGTIGPDGSLRTQSGAHWYGTPVQDLPTGHEAIAVFPPTAVAVYPEPPHGSPRNIVGLTVAEVDTRGPTVLVRGHDQPGGAPGLAACITVDAATELRVAPGSRVWFSVKAQEVALHPAPHQHASS